jgi:hypothetical protein
MNLFSPEYVTAQEARCLQDGSVKSVAEHSEPWTKRAMAAALYLAASDGEVTSDSLLRYFPRPDYINQNAVGAVFSALSKQKKLKITGYTNSLKRSSKHRRIAVYALQSLQGDFR